MDKDNRQRLQAEFALIKDDGTRKLHHTFPDIGTPAGRLKHYKINVYMRNILIQMFGNVWPDIVDAVDLCEYQDGQLSGADGEEPSARGVRGAVGGAHQPEPVVLRVPQHRAQIHCWQNSQKYLLSRVTFMW